MKKRKLPIILITVLVVLVGGAFLFNVISHREADDPEYASQQGRDPSKATGNDAQNISRSDMQKNVAASMKPATVAAKDKSGTSGAPKLRHGIAVDPDAAAEAVKGPMIARSSAPGYNGKPNRVPPGANGNGQWYTDTSASKG